MSDTEPRIARFLRSPAFLAGVLVLAAGLRVWHVVALRDLPLFDRLIVDSEVYDAWAQRIAAGDWLSAGLKQSFFMDPLYSYLLAIVYRIAGRDLLLVRLFQIALGVATCGLVAVLGRKMKDALAGNLAALLLAIYRPAIFQEGEFEKTALGVFLATAALVLFLKTSPRGRMAAGVVLGLAALTRGNVLLLAPCAVVYLLLRGQLRSAAAFALGTALAIAPATFRNHHVAGEWVLTTSMMGQNFYTGNNPENRDGAYHPLSFVRPQSLHEEGDFRSAAEDRTGRKLTAREASSFWLRETVRHVAGSPGFAASVVASKLGLFWSDVEIPDAWDMRFIARYSPPLRLPLVPFSLLVALALLGVVPAWRRDDGRIVVGYVLLYCASIMAFFVLSRYRLHAVPALAALAGVGLVWGFERIRKADYRALAPPVAAAVALGGFSALSYPSYRREAPNNYASLAEIYQERGDFDGARRLLGDALARLPNEASLLCAMGKVCLRTRDAAGAVEYTGRCVRANPAIVDGWYLHGMAYEAGGDLVHAREAYQEQLRRVPGHEAARRRLRD